MNNWFLYFTGSDGILIGPFRNKTAAIIHADKVIGIENILLKDPLLSDMWMLFEADADELKSILDFMEGTSTSRPTLDHRFGAIDLCIRPEDHMEAAEVTSIRGDTDTEKSYLGVTVPCLDILEAPDLDKLAKAFKLLFGYASFKRDSLRFDGEQRKILDRALAKTYKKLPKQLQW